MATTWDLTWLAGGGNAVYSNSDRTFAHKVGDSPDVTAKFANGVTTSDKVYFEIVCAVGPSFDEWYFGLTDATNFTQGQQLGDPGNPASTLARSAWGSGNRGAVNGDRFDFVVDGVNATWAYRKNGGGWIGGATSDNTWGSAGGANPTAGTGMKPIGFTGPWLFACDIFASSNSATINSNSAQWVGTPPSGFGEINAGSGSTSITFASTEPVDTVAAAFTAKTTAALATTEPVDTLAVVLWNGAITAAFTEPVDTLAANILVPTPVSLATTEPVDTFAGAFTAKWNIALATTEPVDTLSANLGAGASVSLATTEPVDSVNIAMSAKWTMALATTEPVDTIAVRVNPITLALVSTEPVDSLSANVIFPGQWVAVPDVSGSWATITDQAGTWTPVSPPSGVWS